MTPSKTYKIPEIGIYIKEMINLSERPILDNKNIVVNVMNKITDFIQLIDYKEIFYILYLNRGLKLLSVYKMSEGSDIDTSVSPKQIIQGAILQNATGIILVHNHPSGIVKPSSEDIIITNMVKRCGKIFDIEIIDHIIISRNDFFSFKSGNYKYES